MSHDTGVMNSTRLPSPCRRSERGAALLEVAITLPLLLLVSVGIFEFGRAYQTWQVLTNAAREGARMAVLPGSQPDEVKAVVTAYLEDGKLSKFGSATVDVSASKISLGATGEASATTVTVNYPFNFTVLNPVVQLVSPGNTLGKGVLTMTASAKMRNESQY